MRYPGHSFEEICDYYSLGGRIPRLEENKGKFHHLMNFISGTDYDATQGKEGQVNGSSTLAVVKKTVIYFSLSADNPVPAPKICIYPANFAPNDEVIAKGLNKWLARYGWYNGRKTMEERVKGVLYVPFSVACPKFWNSANKNKYASTVGGEDGDFYLYWYWAKGRSEEEGSEYSGVYDAGAV